MEMDFQEFGKARMHEEPYSSILNRGIEKLIKETKKRHGWISDQDAKLFFRSSKFRGDYETPLLNRIYSRAISKMRILELIETSNGGLTLKPKAEKFTTFRNEKINRLREQNPLVYEIVKWVLLACLGYVTRVVTEPRDSRLTNKVNIENTKDSLNKK